MRYRSPRKKLSEERPGDPFVRIELNIPKETHRRLKVFSETLGIPLSRIVNIAVYNELDTESPFTFNLDLPEHDFKPGIYKQEAETLHALLKRLPRGCGLDLLVLLRDELGMTRHQILLGYMELKAAGRIEEVVPVSLNFKHPEDYRHIKVKDVHTSTILKNRFKSFEGRYVPRKKGE